MLIPFSSSNDKTKKYVQHTFQERDLRLHDKYHTVTVCVWKMQTKRMRSSLFNFQSCRPSHLPFFFHQKIIILIMQVIGGNVYCRLSISSIKSL